MRGIDNPSNLADSVFSVFAGVWDATFSGSGGSGTLYGRAVTVTSSNPSVLRVDSVVPITPSGSVPGAVSRVWVTRGLNGTADVITVSGNVADTVHYALTDDVNQWNYVNVVVVGIPRIPMFPGGCTNGSAYDQPMHPGESVTLYIEMCDSDGNLLGFMTQFVAWSIDHPEIATITPDGKVTAVAPGVAHGSGGPGFASNGFVITVVP